MKFAKFLIRQIKIHIYKISVFIIQIYVIVLNFIFSWSLFGMIIHIFYTCKLGHLSVFRTVCVWQVVSDIERDVELHVVLGRMLALGSDAVHVVATHGEDVARDLAVDSRVGACSRGQTLEVVIGVGMRHLSAYLVAL